MRLPFLQVAQEEMARARTLAGYLSVPWQHAVGMVVALKAAALELAPEGDVSGTITDPNPAEWMAVQCGWPLDRSDALAVALVRCGFAMAGPSGGHSVAGMEPYAKALETSGKRSDAGRRGAEARKSRGGYGRAMAGPQQSDGQGVARDAKTQTQTQTQKEEALAGSRPPDAQLSHTATQVDPPQRPESEATQGDIPEADPADVLEAFAPALHGGGQAQTGRKLYPTTSPPPLVLTSPKAARKARRPSAAEELYAALQASRIQQAEKAGMQAMDERWPPARQNKALGQHTSLALRPEAFALFEAAWAEYLSDERGAGLDCPWSLGAFLAQLGRWQGRVLKAAGGDS